MDLAKHCASKVLSSWVFSKELAKKKHWLTLGQEKVKVFVSLEFVVTSSSRHWDGTFSKGTPLYL